MYYNVYKLSRLEKLNSDSHQIFHIVKLFFLNHNIPMKYDIIICGVGGQGVLSVAFIIAKAAMGEGLEVRQSEVHGMAQRGGAVVSHLRISDKPIAGDLIPKSCADLIISMEPLEGLRYVSFLKTSGALVSASEPVKNIKDYPDLNGIHSSIKKLPKFKIIQSADLAKEAGFSKAVNTVMVGAASGFLPIKEEALEKTIAETFANKDPKANVKAFKLGLGAAKEK